MYAFDAPLVARFFAIEELRAAGWLHVLETPPRVGSATTNGAGKRARDDAERMWSGATYCPDCAARLAREAPRAASAVSEPREIRVS